MPYGTAMGVVPVLLACSGGASCLVWHLLPGLSMCPGEPIAASSSYRDRQAVLPPGSGEPNRLAPHLAVDDQWQRPTTGPPFPPLP